MNKLYSVITKSLLFILLIGAGGATMGQTLTNAIIPVTTSRPWSALEPGITTCNACTINISNGATLTIDRTVTFGSNSPSTGGSVFNITGGSKLVIGAGPTVNVTLANSEIIVGSPSLSTTDINPDASSLNIANNGTLTLADNTSMIRLANQNNTITAGAGGGSNAAGQILSGLTTSGIHSFFSGNNGTNFANGHLGATDVSTPPYTAGATALITGPAITGTSINFGALFASFQTAITILPITLVDFTASLNSNGAVGLTWATDEEENSAYFNIQRSANGGAWTNIGKVAAQGNSSVTTDYSFTDASPVSGTDDYRLQSTDLNGSYTFSSVKVIRTAGQSAGFSIFPNPASSQVNVSLASTVSNATIRLVDLSGKTLVEQKVTNAANTIVTIPVQGFVNGTYVLVVKSSDGSQYTGKVLIAH